MNKKIGILALILAVIAVCLSGVSLYKSMTPADAKKKDVQYVLYLGTNDKDTNEPVFEPEEAKSRRKIFLSDISAAIRYRAPKAAGRMET